MAADNSLIKACLNGRRDTSEHPAVPITPAQLASAARAATAAGAGAVHIHPRGGDGRESLRAGDVGAAVAAVRVACPGVPIGVTTGLWAAADPATRQAQVAVWAVLDAQARPDFASLNLVEEGWHELAGTLSAIGIGLEAGIWSESDVAALVRYEPPGGWLRIMIEVSGVSADEARPYAEQILASLMQTRPAAPVLLHGEGESCWPLIAHAGSLQLQTRIGLEDVTVGPARQPVVGNADLVRLAIEVWREAAAAADVQGSDEAADRMPES